jgi:hypothetical protein
MFERKPQKAESYNHVGKRMARPFNKVIQYIRLYWTKYETWFTFGVAIPFALSITFLSFLISGTGGGRMVGVWAGLMFVFLIIGIFIISFIARNSGKTETNTRLTNIETKLDSLITEIHDLVIEVRKDRHE